MTPDSQQKLKEILLDDEGLKLFPYTDTTNHTSIGIGRNLSQRGISSQECAQFFENDVNYFTSKLISKLYFFGSLSDARQCALINMCFNLGVNGFFEFTSALDFLKDGKYDSAADAVLDSLAAKQNPNRYKRISDMIRSGEFL